jgi:aryl-alcohol dehydrogenase-like predicted oxidoreductase
MEYRRLGRSGLKVSAISLGAWVTYGSQVGEDVAYECMREAFDAGVNFFDNAEAYASGKAEVVMGNVIRRAGWKRSDLVVSTKLGAARVERQGPQTHRRHRSLPGSKPTTSTCFSAISPTRFYRRNGAGDESRLARRRCWGTSE